MDNNRREVAKEEKRLDHGRELLKKALRGLQQIKVEYLADRWVLNLKGDC